MEHKEFRDLASPERAREAIRDLAISAGTERVPLGEASGRALAERIDAELDVPGFDRSSLDGYALRAADTVGADEADPVRLSLAGAVHAGEEPGVTVDAGEAVEISTGAVMPDGADAMVPVERTDLADEGAGRAGADDPNATAADGTADATGTVLVRTSVAPGDNVAFAGSDVAAGERALGPGTTLTPREIGLLSALGAETVPVRSRPRIGIVSTGDELVPPGEDVDSARGEIYDVNSYAIAAAVEDAGGEPVRYPHVGDDWAAMEDVLREAASECDLVLSSGSTSASAVDVIYRVIEDLGELVLHGVSVKPGKPMLVGRLGESGYVGLPGYPVSAMMVFRTFVAPAIREAAGREEPETATVAGRMAVEERYAEGRHRLMPVGLVEPGPDERATAADETDGSEPSDAASATPLVYPVDRGSGATTSLARADGIVEVPADTDYLPADEPVTVSLFSPSVTPPTLLAVGEDDPTVSRALDDLANPRYLAAGSRPALRQLRTGLPDVAVVAGPMARDPDADERYRFTREWGLLVPAGNPADVDGIEALLDRDLTFVNRTTDSGLRRSFDAALGRLADETDRDRTALEASIAGYDVALRAHESPARRVARGEADVGLGLRDSTDRLSLSFVPLGEQPVRLLVNPDRAAKPSVDRFASALERTVDDRR